MKKLKISMFDLGFLIAAVVVALLGGGAWYYLSGELASAQADVASAKAKFDKYSAYQSSRGSIVVSPSNAKILQTNIDLIRAQFDPLVRAKLQPKENKLGSIGKEDPVAWKADLDDSVQRLNMAAKLHTVTVPPNYYFGFSRYLNQSPSDQQTTVLSKQLMGIEQLVTILINAQVKSIDAIRRTYEEDPRIGSGGGPNQPMVTDQLAGYSFTAAGNAYTSYPLEVEFETTSENLRTVLGNLIQSPYIFVVRSLSIQNTKPDSPVLSSLDQLAGPPAPAMNDTSPGEIAATTSTKGPQYLFGNSTLKVKARVDLVEWTAVLPENPVASAQGNPRTPPSSPGGN